MNTLEDTQVPLEVAADMKAVIDSLSSGVPLTAAVRERIRERGRRLTDELRRRFGALNVSVPSIREFRGEIPDA